MKLLKRGLLILLLALGIFLVLQYPKLNIISGYASKYMASSRYIAHRAPESVTANDLNMPLIKMADIEESTDRSAKATVFGLMERETICRDGLGCVLVPKDMENLPDLPVPHRAQSHSELPFPYGDNGDRDTVFAEVDQAQLQKAVNMAFAQNETQKTRTLLIVYKGQVIAERYAEGLTAETPVLGWSMTKSILATLYGIMQYQGKLDVMAPAPAPEWQQDDRRNITLDHLLRMQSGLAWDEDYSGISDVTRMLFLDPDMTTAQRDKEAVAAPTEIWNYSSGTTNLLSGILRSRFNSHQDYLDFPYQELIDKIGMHSMMIETDMMGNFVGSSYGWATTRDWAKFGLLYLNKGNWNGQQLFAPEWVDYITRPTAHSDGTYGAHFWLNANGKYPDVPKDLFSANGYQGQYVFVIPSKDLVVVRTGLFEYPFFDVNGFLRETVAAISE